MSPSELRTLSCAFDESGAAIVAYAEYALALLHCRHAARGCATDLVLAARHADEAARWLGVAPIGELDSTQFDVARGRLEQVLIELARALEARAAKAGR